MASDVKIVNYTLLCLGDTIYTLIDSVTNYSLSAVTDVMVQVTPPSGVSYKSANLTQGMYDSNNHRWIIGTLTKGKSVSGEMAWTITDDCLSPFKFNFSIGSTSAQVCLSDNKKSSCIIIDGLTKCQFDTFKGIKTVTSDYTLTLGDYTILIDASFGEIEILLPDPEDAYKVFPEKASINGGKEYYLKVINLTNPVMLKTPSGKIVDFSTAEDASDTYSFSMVGQSLLIQSNGTNYYVKTTV